MLLRNVSVLLGTVVALAACSSDSSSNDYAGCSAGAASAKFTVDGSSLLMNGVIDCSTPSRLQTALDNHAVTEVVLQNVPGSMDDESNLKAARMLRNRGSINTRVSDNGAIASGGVDFFIAGVERSVGKNAIVAVHSWQDGSGEQGITLYNKDPDNEAHQTYIQYYQDMGLSAENATNFYVFTLESAPAEGTHCMSADELKRYTIVTGGQLDGSVALQPTTNDNNDYCTH